MKDTNDVEEIKKWITLVEGINDNDRVNDNEDVDSLQKNIGLIDYKNKIDDNSDKDSDSDDYLIDKPESEIADGIVKYFMKTKESEPLQSSGGYIVWVFTDNSNKPYFATFGPNGKLSHVTTFDSPTEQRVFSSDDHLGETLVNQKIDNKQIFSPEVNYTWYDLYRELGIGKKEIDNSDSSKDSDDSSTYRF